MMWKTFTNSTANQIKEKNKIKYSTNSEIEELIESLKRSKTAAGV